MCERSILYDGKVVEQMKYILHIDAEAEECVTITAHAPSALTDAIEALIKEQHKPTVITLYREGELRTVAFEDIECLTVTDGKTIAILADGETWQVRHRLYELEQIVPTYFIRINKSALANIHRLKKFSSTYAGAVNAQFQSGYTDYVSRRCFANIKRRLAK